MCEFETAEKNFVRWNNDLIFELIDLYRERPALWDTTSEDYKNRDKKHDAWSEIASRLNTDKDTIQRKMKSLITQYRREMSKVNVTCQLDDIRWFAFKKLMFLNLKVTPKQTVSTGINEREREDDEISEVIIKAEEDDGDEDVLFEEQIVIEQAIRSDTQSDYVGSSHRDRKRPRQSSKSNETQELTIDVSKERDMKDEYSAFGEVVAMKLRKICNKYARSTAQFHINNILYNAEIGEYDK